MVSLKYLWVIIMTELMCVWCFDDSIFSTIGETTQARTHRRKITQTTEVKLRIGSSCEVGMFWDYRAKNCSRCDYTCSECKVEHLLSGKLVS